MLPVMWGLLFVRFARGKLNVCHNAVDRHVESGRGDQPAIIYDSPVTGTKQTITFRELQEQVMISTTFRELQEQVMISTTLDNYRNSTLCECCVFQPKMIVTASFGIEPGRRVEYIPLVEKALELSSHSPSKVLIDNRPGMEKVSMHLDLSLDWEEEMSTARPHDCVSLPASHPLYVLYTSGTTGTPKGVVRDTAGYAVMLTWTMANVYGLKPGEVMSDLGWVVGHSYSCVTTIVEGKPVGTPDAGALFRVLSEHGCSSMFTAPKAIQAIRQQDTHSAIGAQYPLTSSVLNLFCPFESGSAITSSCIGLGNSLSPPMQSPQTNIGSRMALPKSCDIFFLPNFMMSNYDLVSSLQLPNRLGRGKG
uniref:Acyl-CoA synthetase short-chain family member 3, mitochondrial n=1 Tax=Oncorhynchus tshawytscha TaxID=74940 RepID=A0AAZ3R3I8_ONCTS